MLAELIPQSYDFSCGETTISLRYDMSALLQLERRGLSYEKIFDEKITKGELCAFLIAAIHGEAPVAPVEIIDTVGALEVWQHLRKAVLLSMPEYDPLIIELPPEGGGKPDMKRLHCLICDVMGKSEEFFWSSTMRELLSRWQDYGEIKGLVRKPERMVLYDTEGM